MSSNIAYLIEETSREKRISKEDVVKALEKAFLDGAHVKYGKNRNLKVVINKAKGIPVIYHGRTIVESNPSIDEISLEDAMKTEDVLGGKVEPQIGEVVYDEILPGLMNNRECMQVVKTSLIHELDYIGRERQYKEFSEHLGSVFQVTVKNIKKTAYGTDVFVDIDSYNEGIIRRKDAIPGEVFHLNEKIFAQLTEVIMPAHHVRFKENQLIFSRSSEQFVGKLLEKSVHEIRDGSIEIMSLSRIAGFKTKIAVRSVEALGHYGKIDPVYACIGPSGSVVKELRNELRGEKIDIFKWSDDPKELLLKAIYPIVPFSVNIMDHIIEVIVPESSIGQAIGPKGNNIKLISNILGRKVNIMTEDQAKEHREGMEIAAMKIKEHLEIDEITARLLVVHGYTDPAAIANAGDHIYTLGIQEDLLVQIINNAQYLYVLSALEQYGVSQSLFDILQTLPINELLRCVKLAEKGILTTRDLGSLSIQEFVSIVPDTKMTEEQIESLINTATNYPEEDALDADDEGAN